MDAKPKHVRTSLAIDKEAVQAAMPYLYKDGFSVSAYVRKMLWAYVEKKEAEDAPLTIDQIATRERDAREAKNESHAIDHFLDGM